MSGREREESEFENATMLALKMEKGATRQRMSAACGNWKREGNGFSHRAASRKTAWLTP